MTSTPMSDPHNSRVGLGAPLTPDKCVLMLIDHQPFQSAGAPLMAGSLQPKGDRR
jgi:hypothetical protein